MYNSPRYYVNRDLAPADVVRLLLRDEVLQRHDPRVAREHADIVLRVVGQQALEHRPDLALAHGGGGVVPHAVRVVLAVGARIATERAVLAHVRRVVLALPVASPRRAIRAQVTALALQRVRQPLRLRLGLGEARAQRAREVAVRLHEAGVGVALASLGPARTSLVQVHALASRRRLHLWRWHHARSCWLLRSRGEGEPAADRKGNQRSQRG